MQDMLHSPAELKKSELFSTKKAKYDYNDVVVEADRKEDRILSMENFEKLKKENVNNPFEVDDENESDCEQYY